MKGRHLKKKKRRLLPLLCALLALALAGAALFWLLDPLGRWGSAGAFRLDEPVRALVLPMPAAEQDPFGQQGVDKAAAQALLQGMVETAAAAGANTLLFQVQAPGSSGVYYRDRNFDPVNRAFDLTRMACETARQAGLQVYLLAAPFAAAPADQGAAGPLAAKRAGQLRQMGDQLWFSPDDGEAVQALARSMAALARRYPAAGVILTGFSFAYTDATSEPLTAALQAILARMEGEAGGKQLGLAVETGFSAAALPALQGAGLDFLLAQPAGAEELARWQAAGLPVLAARPWGDAGGEAAAGFDALLRSRYLAGGVGAAGDPQPEAALLLERGAALGSLAEAQADPGRVGLQMSYFASPPAVEAPALPAALSLSYPAAGAVFYGETAVLLGTSDPALPLTLSDGAAPRRAAGGSFTAEVPLQMGSNLITLSQPGGQSLQLTLVRQKPAGSSGRAPKPDTRLDESLAGQTVEVTAQLASALTDPHNDDAIAMTLRAGGRIRVLGRTETLRAGAVTGAYLLESGDYLLEEKAELLGELPPARLAAPTPLPGDRGDLTLRMEGGAPACYDDLQGETLTLTFYGAGLAFDPAALCNEFILSAAAAPAEEGQGVTLTLQCDRSVLWGYDLQYEENATLLTLRRAPAASSQPAAPLTGVRVLLDPGHGGADTGAAGIGGGLGVAEKELNLALALAAKARLEQLGATVFLTRAGDESATLAQRWAAAQSLQPDFFIAIHHNSTALAQDPAGVRGLQAYYFERHSRPLADSLMQAVSAATGRAAEEPSWGYFYVTRLTAAPAVLFEFGFLVDPQEFEDCASAAGIRAAAEGIAEGVLRATPGPAPNGAVGR